MRFHHHPQPLRNGPPAARPAEEGLNLPSQPVVRCCGHQAKSQPQEAGFLIAAFKDIAACAGYFLVSKLFILQSTVYQAQGAPENRVYACEVAEIQ